jgi:hypothetical protein
MLTEAGAHFGECVTLRRANPDTLEDELIITQADPRVLIHAELLAEIIEGQHHPWATFTPAEHPPPGWRPGSWRGPNPLGGILRIKASNRTVIYRITDWHTQTNRFAAEWPD